MSFLTRLFPAACSRLKIFICYGHKDGTVAHAIAQSLTNDGHEVFIDVNSLTVGSDYNEKIRDFIDRADRFVFLASSHSLSLEAYPQTELGFAQKRWPAPKNAVWPVIVEPGLDVQSIPLYLRSVHIFTPKGNIAADLAAAIARSRSIRPWCWACSTVALLLMAASIAMVAIPSLLNGTVELAGLKQVDLRPKSAPQDGQPWTKSPAMLTLKTVSYNNQSGDRVIVKGETVTLALGKRNVEYTGYNEVDMKDDCGSDWLCTKGSLKPLTLEPHSGSGRETMYEPVGTNLPWDELIDALCQSTAAKLDITVAPQIVHSAWSQVDDRAQTCSIDLKEQRAQLAKACGESARVLPFWITTRCQ